MSNEHTPSDFSFESMGIDLPEIHPAVPMHEMLGLDESGNDVLLMLLDLPQNTLRSVVTLLSDYDDATKAVIASIVAREAMSRDGRTFEDVAGTIHHAAVVAPVYTAFASADPEYDIESNIMMMCQSLEWYWKCDPSGFRLDADNRFYFARGLSLHTIVAENGVSLTYRNDQHLTWTGSRFEELAPHAAEIMRDRSLTRSTLEEISLRWTKQHVGANGELSQRFLMEHHDRLNGYEDYYSVLPEDVWEQMQTKLYKQNGSFRLYLDFNGVTLESRQHMFLRHFHENLNEAPFMKLLSSLSDGTGKMKNGDAALMMLNFGEGTLAFIEDACEDYTLTQRRLVSDALNQLALRTGELSNLELLEHFALYVSTAMPLIEEFFVYNDGMPSSTDDLLSRLSAGSDWDEILAEQETDSSEHLEDLMWEHTEDCFGIFHRVINGVDITPEKYTFLARGITAIHVIGYKEQVTEDEILYIGSHLETILKNADTLRESKDLRGVNLNRLSRDAD